MRYTFKMVVGQCLNLNNVKEASDTDFSSTETFRIQVPPLIGDKRNGTNDCIINILDQLTSEKKFKCY